jgi:hypothetical protein
VRSLIAAVSLLAIPAALRGQELNIWIDAGAAHARPPADWVGVGAMNLGVLGTRVSLERFGPAALELELTGGRSTRPGAGGWVEGALRGDVARRVGRYTLSAHAETFRLGYQTPVAYRQYGATLLPRASTSVGPFSLSLEGELTRGRWRFQDSAFALTGPLALSGATLTAGRTVGRVWAEANARVLTARNAAVPGAYQALGASVTYMEGRLGGVLGTELWQTPHGLEGAYRAAGLFSVSDRMDATVALGRSATAPLYGSPGSFTASAMLSWKLSSVRKRPTTPRVVELAEPLPGGRRVRFYLSAVDARRVSLTGDFTGWRPRPMQRSGDTWLLDLVLKPGVYHFGFLLDGERWYVPDGAPGLVDDGWGRRNASLVVEGA